MQLTKRQVELLAAAWLLADAILSIAYSTDLIVLFQVGRALRFGIGLFLLFGRKLPYANYFGIYLALEAIGSTVVSPDQDILWQLGRIGRVFIGIWLYKEHS